MGRLRHDEDFHFLAAIATEVIDLFGCDAILYRYVEAPAENVARRDPLYDEPQSPRTVARKAYRIKMHWQNLQENAFHNETGMGFENLADGFVALDHLVAAGCKADVSGDYISEGDVLRVNPGTHNEGIYDIVNTNKMGFSGTSHQYVGYNIRLARNTNFDPSRNDGVLP